MLVQGIDNDRCTRRNQLSAARGRNVVPLVFVGTPKADNGVQSTSGKLADDIEGAIKAINAVQPTGAAPLGADDVYVHYVEAANKNFIRKYYMKFTDRSLKNFAADAMAGVAFMNSHRTGDISTPSELPFGNTFGGRYELLADGTAHTLVGVYMRRGLKPNGDGGPSTDDLHAQIEAGIQKADSVGVPAGGQSICAVCENPLNARDEQGAYLCSHVPGTPRNMTTDERKRMKAAGVPNGYAFFWLDDAHLAEVSAVYSGALPGAGVRKVLNLARQHQLSDTELKQARTAYGLLLGKDFGMDVETNKALEDTVTRGMRRALRAEQRAAPLSNPAKADPAPQTGADNDEAVALRRELAEMKATMRNERAASRAKDFAIALAAANKVTPTELAPLRSLAAAIYSLCEGSPELSKMVDANGATVTLAAGMEAVFSARPVLPLTGEQIQSQAGQLVAAPDQSGGDESFKTLMGSITDIVAARNKKGGAR